MAAVENGGTPPPRPAPQLAYSREQIDAIQKLKNAKSDWERLGLTPTASKYVTRCHAHSFISSTVAPNA